jgi:hypothetical protein
MAGKDGNGEAEGVSLLNRKQVLQRHLAPHPEVQKGPLDIERGPVKLTGSTIMRVFRDGNVPIALAAIEGIDCPSDESL